MTIKIVFLPFEMIVVKGKVKLNTHSKCVNIMIKPIVEHSEHIAMGYSYGILKPSSSKENICLYNMSTKEVVVSMKTAIGEIVAANAIPAMLVPKTKKKL